MRDDTFEAAVIADRQVGKTLKMVLLTLRAFSYLNRISTLHIQEQVERQAALIAIQRWYTQGPEEELPCIKGADVVAAAELIEQAPKFFLLTPECVAAFSDLDIRRNAQ